MKIIITNDYVEEIKRALDLCNNTEILRCSKATKSMLYSNEELRKYLADKNIILIDKKSLPNFVVVLDKKRSPEDRFVIGFHDQDIRIDLSASEFNNNPQWTISDMSEFIPAREIGGLI